MLSTIIISPDEGFRDHIREILEGSDQIEIRAELNNFYSALDSWIFDEIKSMEADIIIVDLSPDKEQGIITIEKIVEISKHSHIFVSCDNTEADTILRSMRAGAKDILSRPPVESQTLFAAIERISRVHAVLNKEKKRYGKLFTFFSAKGGTGSTVISTNFAVNLAEQTKKPTIIVAESYTPLYESWIKTFPNPEERLKSITAKIPLEKRMTTTEEIANMAVFLLSEKSSHTTGQLIHVDGGYVHLDRAIG